MGVVASDSIQLTSLKTVKDAATEALAQAASATSSAQSAQASAIAAGRSAAQAQAAADAAQGEIDDMQEYFWHDALGAHVLSNTNEETHETYRTDIKGDGLSINRLYSYGGETSEFEVANFSASEARIGRKTNSASILMTPEYMNFYAPDGSITGSIRHGSAQSSEVGAEVIYNGAIRVGDTYSLKLRFKPGDVMDQRVRVNFYRPNGVLNPTNQAIFDAYTSEVKTIVYHTWNASEDTCTIKVSYDADDYTVTFEALEMSEGAYEVTSNVKVEYTSTFLQPRYSFGVGLESTGKCSFAEGWGSTASGDYSHAGGCGTIANGEAQTVIGKYNAADPDALFIIGSGTADTDRSNAFQINDNGYIFRRGSNMGCDLRLTDASSQIGQAPSSDKYTAPFLLKDSDDSNTCFIQNVIFANGNLRTDYMTTRLDASGTRLANGFYQHIYADGTYGITFTNAATKAAWLAGLGAAPELNYQEKNFNTVAVSSNKSTTIGNTGSLTGRYLCIATACFATNTSGRRAIWISTTNTGNPYSRYSRVMHAPASGDVTHLQFVLLITCNNTTLYLRAYQNSGSSLNVTDAGIKLMPLS